MKRVFAAMIALSLAGALGARELLLGTREVTMRYAPVIAKALEDSGYTGKAKGFATQPELLAALGKGEVDGGFFLPQPVVMSVKGAVLVPIKLGETSFIAVTTDPAIKINNAGDLKNYKVGIVKDHTGHLAVTRGLTVTAAPGDFEEVKLLTDGKVQVIIILEEILPILAKPAGLKNYYQSVPLLRTPNFLALSAAKGGEEAKVEAALKKFTESKQYDEEMALLNGAPPKK
jgi:hypothetical protein